MVTSYKKVMTGDGLGLNMEHPEFNWFIIFILQLPIWCANRFQIVPSIPFLPWLNPYLSISWLNHVKSCNKSSLLLTVKWNPISFIPQLRKSLGDAAQGWAWSSAPQRGTVEKRSPNSLDKWWNIRIWSSKMEVNNEKYWHMGIEFIESGLYQLQKSDDWGWFRFEHGTPRIQLVHHFSFYSCQFGVQTVSR